MCETCMCVEVYMYVCVCVFGNGDVLGYRLRLLDLDNKYLT